MMLTGMLEDIEAEMKNCTSSFRMKQIVYRKKQIEKGIKKYSN